MGPKSSMGKSKALIVGAAGAVGKRLCAALSRSGTEVIAADRMQYMPSTVQHVASKCIGGIDVRDRLALQKLFAEHADDQTPNDGLEPCSFVLSRHGYETGNRGGSGDWRPRGDERGSVSPTPSDHSATLHLATAYLLCGSWSIRLKTRVATRPS